MVIFAKTLISAKKLNDLFKNRQTDKNYICVVNGEINKNQKNELVHMIEKTQNSKVNIYDNNSNNNNNNENVNNKINNKQNEQANDNKINNKNNNLKNNKNMEFVEAKLKFEILSILSGGADKNKKQTVIKVELETGRKHQIRAQMSLIGKLF